jgi:hypothetical protein
LAQLILNNTQLAQKRVKLEICYAHSIACQEIVGLQQTSKILNNFISALFEPRYHGTNTFRASTSDQGPAQVCKLINCQIYYMLLSWDTHELGKFKTVDSLSLAFAQFFCSPQGSLGIASFDAHVHTMGARMSQGETYRLNQAGNVPVHQGSSALALVDTLPFA